MAATSSRTGVPDGLATLEDAFTSAVRLRMCAYLSGCEEADFKAVQEYCGLTQPSLSKNVTLLVERGFVAVSKVASGRYTKTRLRLTDAGQAALEGHVAALQGIVDSARIHRASE
jgi:DNA-binding MarR family transcriptional regulator